MFLVLKKSSIKRTLALSILMVIAGFALANPLQASAASQVVYLYPYQTNNPVQPSGLFWWESHPQLGAYTMVQWDQLLGNQLKVIAIPEYHGFILAKNFQSGMLGNNIGNWVVYKLRKRMQDKMKPGETPMQQPVTDDPFVYKRKVGNTTEEIKIPKSIINDHFKDNDNFDKFMDTVKRHLTDNDLIKDVNKRETPVPEDKITIPDQPHDQQQLHAAGNALMLGGVLLMILKLAPLLAL